MLDLLIFSQFALLGSSAKSHNYYSLLGFYIGAEMGGYTAVRYDDMEAWNSEQN